MCVGAGSAMSAGADRSVRMLVQALDALFVPLPMGKGVLPDSHELRTAARGSALRGRDVAVVVGGQLNWMLGLGRPPFRP